MIKLTKVLFLLIMLEWELIEPEAISRMEMNLSLCLISDYSTEQLRESKPEEFGHNPDVPLSQVTPSGASCPSYQLTNTVIGIAVNTIALHLHWR